MATVHSTPVRLKALFRLVRPVNLVIVLATFLIIYLGLVVPVLQKAEVEPAMSFWSLFFLLFSLILLTAGGYVINDIIDQPADQVNKPRKQIVGKWLSTGQANSVYMAIVSLAGISALIAAIMENRVLDLWIFVAAWVGLHLYSTHFKGTGLPANILIGFYCAGVVLLPVYAEWDGWKKAYFLYDDYIIRLQLILWAYAFFAFLSTLIRELIKDLQDMEGDVKQGYQTLPLRIGEQRTLVMVSTLVGLLLLILIYFSLQLNLSTIENLLCFLMLGAPLLLVPFELARKKYKPNYKSLSSILKTTMANGLLILIVLLIIYT